MRWFNKVRNYIILFFFLSPSFLFGKFFLGTHKHGPRAPMCMLLAQSQNVIGLWVPSSSFYHQSDMNDSWIYPVVHHFEYTLEDHVNVTLNFIHHWPCMGGDNWGDSWLSSEVWDIFCPVRSMVDFSNTVSGKFPEEEHPHVLLLCKAFWLVHSIRNCQTWSQKSTGALFWQRPRLMTQSTWLTFPLAMAISNLFWSNNAVAFERSFLPWFKPCSWWNSISWFFFQRSSWSPVKL